MTQPNETNRPQAKRTITFGRVVAALVLIGLVLNVTGFSFQRFRWLSSNDYLQIAANEIMKTERGKRNYRSSSEIIDNNPGCCDIKSVNDGIESSIGRIFGWIIKIVTIVFKTPIDSDEPYYEEIYFIDRNGEVRENWGTGSKIPGNYLK